MCQNIKSVSSGLDRHVLFLGYRLRFYSRRPTPEDPTAPNVTYEMWLPRACRWPANYCVLGMNNLGDVLVSCSHGLRRTQYSSGTRYTNEWVNV